MHPSVQVLWRAYLRSIGETPTAISKTFAGWSFGDTDALADELLELVLAGVKWATPPSVWELEARGEPMPQPGDLHVITDSAGVARCIIRTTRVLIKPFNEVGSEYARSEGEGDGTLAYWRRTHGAYYERVLADTDYASRPEMPAVCEQFEVVFHGGRKPYPLPQRRRVSSCRRPIWCVWTSGASGYPLRPLYVIGPMPNRDIVQPRDA